MRSFKKLVLTTLVFCAGIGVIVTSFRHYGLYGTPNSGHEIEPFLFASGLAVCIVSGVVLLKAIRDYLE